MSCLRAVQGSQDGHVVEGGKPVTSVSTAILKLLSRCTSACMQDASAAVLVLKLLSYKAVQFCVQ